MDGVLDFHKSRGITSAKALYAVRKLIRQRKSGHAGTLDPAATGVLVLCFGRATKLTERIMDHAKVYAARARLDVTSESFDADRPMMPVEVGSPPDHEAVASALAQFEGEIQQIPPAISAVKIGGQPAYKLQRAGRVPELKARPARIYWIRLTSYDWPELAFTMACGRGTYVRSVIRDLGTSLGTGGCLTELTRTRVGPFTAEDAVTLDELEASDDPAGYVIPLEAAGAMLSEQIVPPPPDAT